MVHVSGVSFVLDPQELYTHPLSTLSVFIAVFTNLTDFVIVAVVAVLTNLTHDLAIRTRDYGTSQKGSGSGNGRSCWSHPAGLCFTRALTKLHRPPKLEAASTGVLVRQTLGNAPRVLDPEYSRRIARRRIHLPVVH